MDAQAMIEESYQSGRTTPELDAAARAFAGKGHALAERVVGGLLEPERDALSMYRAAGASPGATVRMRADGGADVHFGLVSDDEPAQTMYCTALDRDGVAENQVEAREFEGAARDLLVEVLAVLPPAGIEKFAAFVGAGAVAAATVRWHLEDPRRVAVVLALVDGPPVVASLPALFAWASTFVGGQALH
jgi:hypothetical protein